MRNFDHRLSPDISMTYTGIECALEAYLERSEGQHPSIIICAIDCVEYAHRAVQQLLGHPMPRVVGLVGMPPEWWGLFGPQGFVWSDPR
jgi:hypothetical protein